MTAPENLVGAVCDSLATFADHVSLLPAEDYCAAVPELAGATIGQHVRHCIDHYVTLSDGIAMQKFDYDDRARCPEIECDRDRALGKVRGLLKELRPALLTADMAAPVHVRTASSSKGEVAWQQSSLGRELQFVLSHTVHHAAMVANSCRVRGLPVSAEHGVAPSTLRHRRAMSARS
tara:strand:+ start:40479 stop:41009 length:531 start_codon:yes stop_codon:yes gene_type:complete